MSGLRMALVTWVMLVACHTPTEAQGKKRPMAQPTVYRATETDGLSIFYREAGPNNAPTLHLLHGLPSSSRMTAVGGRTGRCLYSART